MQSFSFVDFTGEIIVAKLWAWASTSTKATKIIHTNLRLKSIKVIKGINVWTLNRANLISLAIDYETIRISHLHLLDVSIEVLLQPFLTIIQLQSPKV